MEREKQLFGNTDSLAGFGFNREAVVGDNQRHAEAPLGRRIKPAERVALALVAATLLFAIVNQAHAQDESPFENTPTTTEPCPQNLSDYTHIPVFDGGYLNQKKDSITWVRTDNKALGLPENASSLQVANAAEGKPVCQNTGVYDYKDITDWHIENSSEEPRLFLEKQYDLSTGEESMALYDINNPYIYMPKEGKLAFTFNPYLSVSRAVPDMPYIWGFSSDPECFLNPQAEINEARIGGNYLVTEKNPDGLIEYTLVDPYDRGCEPIPPIIEPGYTGLDWNNLAQEAFRGCPNLPDDFHKIYPKIGAGDGTATATNEEGTEFIYVPYDGDRCEFKNGSTR